MNKNICAAIILSAAVGVLGCEYVSEQPSEPAPAPKPPAKTVRSAAGVGWVDLYRLKSLQLEGDLIVQLEEQEQFLRLELKNAMRPIIIEEPTVESKPFDDSVWQKNAQTIISEAAEIERRKKQAAEDYRKSTEAEYLQKRDENNNRFLNEILNIRLKLQNAKTMRLTDDEIRAMEARLEELQDERGKIQHELEEQWIAEIAAHAEESIKDDVEKLRAQAQASMERVKAQAAADQAAAQARNKAVMERAQAQTARRELQQSLSNELQEVIEKRHALEAQLIQAIEDEVSRLAVIHNLEVILLRREVDADEKFYPYSFDEGLWIDLLKQPKTGAAIFPTSASIDLTEELIKELKKRKTLFGSND